MSDERAVRYRRLAMQERDPQKSAVLQLLATEAEKGILHTPALKIPTKPAAVVPE